MRGSKFSAIREEILSRGNCIITGAAGTGKSEILKSLYLQSENQYLESINQVTPNNDTPIPVFVRLRECVNGNLEDLLRNRLKDFDINVCGIAGDYCVLETIKGLRKYIGDSYITVLFEYIASIDSGKKLKEYVSF